LVSLGINKFPLSKNSAIMLSEKKWMDFHYQRQAQDWAMLVQNFFAQRNRRCINTKAVGTSYKQTLQKIGIKSRPDNLH
jgi:hypothetical protein